MKLYTIFFKRLFDIIFSAAMLIIASPIIFLLIFILFFVNKGNPLFLQKRPGKDERIFKIVKFKTMNDKKDESGNLLPDEKRITAIGKIIRGTSIDEILQLVNVLKGDMSLVGPRPLLVEYLSLYNEEQKRRHLVRPGITGWAQVNGRNAISWQKKFELDIWYVENISLLLDVRILFYTVIKVIRKKDINSSNSVSIEKFNGQN